jgi:hypothetical protein
MMGEWLPDRLGDDFLGRLVVLTSSDLACFLASLLFCLFDSFALFGWFDLLMRRIAAKALIQDGGHSFGGLET